MSMSFDEADRLLKEILVFLHRQGGGYRQIRDVGGLQKNILIALATGRFFYDQNSFVCWIFNGDLLHVQEAAGDLKAIRRILRQQIRTGVSWARPERNRSIYRPDKRS